jgi:hypothetical protein
LSATTRNYKNEKIISKNLIPPIYQIYDVGF